ncbi:MAG: hypothetical protein HOI07_05955 [Betaproteobacteria bacterium]|jgi:ubiquitin C-terminal hydrolase|nr:hypothetical protein [Betaproteobacteria bacterium]
MHGFYNNGNTCFFNAAIQCVLNIKELTGYVLKNEYTGSCEFTKVYTDLVRMYFSKEKGVINIDFLLQRFRNQFPRFKSYQPHDAQDALFCIIDILEKELPILKTIVYGKRSQYTVCPSGSKSLEEPFSFLILNNTNAQDTVSKMITSSERWDVLSDYRDDSGVTHNVSTTRSMITEYPKILFVSFDKKQFVEVDEFKQYEICGSILHIGTQNGGHYITILKQSDGKWYLHDDDEIKEVAFPVKAAHHVLMYRIKSHSS